MAKKEFSFEDLNGELSKVSNLGNTMDVSEISLVDSYIHSGNYMLNAALTGSLKKGFPANRAVELAGPSRTGKTFLLLNAVREAQKEGYYIVFFDSENAVDRTVMTKFGIDVSKVRYEPINTVQEFRTIITRLTEVLIEKKRSGNVIPKLFIALDSIGNLATQKEIEDANSGSEKADMTRAKVIKSIFRIIMTRLAEIKAPLLYTNHVYVGQGFIPQTISSGGCLDENELVLMSDNSYKKIGDIKIGDYVKTLDGNKEILQTYIFNKKRYKIEFEDGTEIICSEDHRNYIGNNLNKDWNNDASWFFIKDAKIGDKLKIYYNE